MDDKIRSKIVERRRLESALERARAEVAAACAEAEAVAREVASLREATGDKENRRPTRTSAVRRQEFEFEWFKEEEEGFFRQEDPPFKFPDAAGEHGFVLKF